MESPGRNAPCPCGSGKKYKACCLRAKGAEGKPDVGLNRDMLLPMGMPLKTGGEVAVPRPKRTREMDRAAVDAIQEAVLELHCRLGREHGLVVRQKKHTYSKWNSRVEFEVAVEREDGIVMDELAENFLERCGDYGLKAEDLGRPFRAGEATFRITGLRPRAKIPILCEQVDPKLTEVVEHRFKPSVVRHYLHECSAQHES